MNCYKLRQGKLRLDDDGDWVPFDEAEAKIERLRADYQEAHRVQEHRHADEIERLRAIVDKLPKTADGVPVVPGMKLFFLCPFENRITSDQVFQDRPEVGGMTIEVSNCYSTREAAEAAGGDDE